MMHDRARCMTAALSMMHDRMHGCAMMYDRARAARHACAAAAIDGRLLRAADSGGTTTG